MRPPLCFLFFVVFFFSLGQGKRLEAIYFTRSLSMLRDIISPKQIRLKFQACQHLADALYAATEEENVCLIGPLVPRMPCFSVSSSRARDSIFQRLSRSYLHFSFFLPFPPLILILTLTLILPLRLCCESAMVHIISNGYSSRCTG